MFGGTRSGKCWIVRRANEYEALGICRIRGRRANLQDGAPPPSSVVNAFVGLSERILQLTGFANTPRSAASGKVAARTCRAVLNATEIRSADRQRVETGRTLHGACSERWIMGLDLDAPESDTAPRGKRAEAANTKTHVAEADPPLPSRRRTARKRPEASKHRAKSRRPGGKRPQQREQAPEDVAAKTTESGRLRHREHQRSEEAGHEPRRGEVSTGQEP
jgi:hypothetical protein